MDEAAIREVFDGIGAIEIKRMFGGLGVWRDGMLFAIEAGGELYLKSDDESRASFEDLGLEPFAFNRAGKEVHTSFRRAPASIFDDPSEMRRWTESALTAAARSGAARRRGSQER